MKRRNDNFWRRWFLMGTALFIVYFIILLFNLLNQKESLSNENLWEYIGLLIGISAKFTGALMVYSLLIHFLFDILFPFIKRTIRIPFYKPRINRLKNQYVEKKTIWTILKNGFFFVLLLSTSQIILAYISVLIQGKEIIWHKFPQMFAIAIGGGIVIYIFLLLVEESWK